MTTTLKKYGDADYGHFGVGFCNPAFYDQEPVQNEVYLNTLQDGYPWKPVLEEGFRVLDEHFPGWRVRQIKSKFNECRFYATPPEGSDREQFQALLSIIESSCDDASRRE